MISGPVLRYLGAAKDLESNTFTTREEAIRAIQELKDRRRTGRTILWLRMLCNTLGLAGAFVCLSLRTGRLGVMVFEKFSERAVTHFTVRPPVDPGNSTWPARVTEDDSAVTAVN